MVAGDDGCEAYTAIMWSGILSRERDNPAEAEAVDKVEGNMLRTVMRGATALPWSETPLRMKGTRPEPGRPHLAQTAMAGPGRDGKPRRRSRRGRGEESDGCILPGKPRTKPTANRWRRWWREGGRSEGRRAATHAPDSVPDAACNRSCEPADWGCMGRQSPEPRSRSTFGRSPVRGASRRRTVVMLCER